MSTDALPGARGYDRPTHQYLSQLSRQSRPQARPEQRTGGSRHATVPSSRYWESFPAFPFPQHPPVQQQGESTQARRAFAAADKGASAFQSLKVSPARPPSAALVEGASPRGIATPRATGSALGPALHDAQLSIDACKGQLGDSTFEVVRTAMLAQQEIFAEQLWELHRLARVQERKAQLLENEAARGGAAAGGGCAAVPLDLRSLFDRSRQAEERAAMFAAITALRTLPGTLRRAGPRTAQRLTQQPVPLDSLKGPAAVAPSNLSSLVHAAVDQGRARLASAAPDQLATGRESEGPPGAAKPDATRPGSDLLQMNSLNYLMEQQRAHFDASSLGSSNPLAGAATYDAFGQTAGGSLDALCYLHGVRMDGVGRVSERDAFPPVLPPPVPQPPSDMSALLNMGLPGAVAGNVDLSMLFGNNDPHMQWFNKNHVAAGAPQATQLPPKGAGLQDVLNERPLPDLKFPHNVGNECSGPNPSASNSISNSWWTAPACVLLPGMQPGMAPAAGFGGAQGLQHKGMPGLGQGLGNARFSGYDMEALMRSQAVNSAQQQQSLYGMPAASMANGQVNASPVNLKRLRNAGNSKSSDSQGSGNAMTVDEQALANLASGQGHADAEGVPQGKKLHTKRDESAASILMSLKDNCKQAC